MKLRKLEDGEDFRGIYNALNSYDGISDNDIIVVENEVGEYAYFGDLNTRLAIRAGASGAIIFGATRDMKETASLDFPVFAKSYNAADVRRRATLDYINKPIKVENKIINPGDMIFADICSVVVIYEEFISEVIDRALQTFQNENMIVKDILNEKSVLNIVQDRGTF